MQFSSENEVEAAAGSSMDENEVVEYPGIPLSQYHLYLIPKYFEEEMMFFPVKCIQFSLDKMKTNVFVLASFSEINGKISQPEKNYFQFRLT